MYWIYFLTFSKIFNFKKWCKLSNSRNSSAAVKVKIVKKVKKHQGKLKNCMKNVSLF